LGVSADEGKSKRLSKEGKEKGIQTRLKRVVPKGT